MRGFVTQPIPPTLHQGLAQPTQPIPPYPTHPADIPFMVCACVALSPRLAASSRAELAARPPRAARSSPLALRPRLALSRALSLTPSPRCRVARPKVSPETAAPLGPAYTLYPPTLQDSRLCRPSLYPPTQNPPHLPYPTHRKTQTQEGGGTCTFQVLTCRTRPTAGLVWSGVHPCSRVAILSTIGTKILCKTPPATELILGALPNSSGAHV